MDAVIERDAVEQQALSWPQKADRHAITNATTYTEAAEMLKGIKALREEANGVFDPPIEAAYRSHKAAIEAKRKIETPLAETEKILKAKMGTYIEAENKRAKDEQRKLEEEERRRIEEDRLNLAAHMEREGNEFGDAGLVQEANELISQPIVPVVAKVQPAVPKVANISYRTTWSAQLVNLHELVKFVAANPSHVGLLSANMPALNAQARSLKGALRIPGVQALETRDVAAGR